MLHGHCADLGRDPAEIQTSLQVRVHDIPEAIEKASAAAEAGADEVIFLLPPPWDIGLVEPLAEEARRAFG